LQQWAVVVTLIPGTPVISIGPATSLAPFIAPAVLDAAYDLPEQFLETIIGERIHASQPGSFF